MGIRTEATYCAVDLCAYFGAEVTAVALGVGAAAGEVRLDVGGSLVDVTCSSLASALLLSPQSLQRG